jgi:hypothetical protein
MECVMLNEWKLGTLGTGGGGSTLMLMGRGAGGGRNEDMGCVYMRMKAPI